MKAGAEAKNRPKTKEKRVTCYDCAMFEWCGYMNDAEKCESFQKISLRITRMIC
jgi:hypothetical protein